VYYDTPLTRQPQLYFKCNAISTKSLRFDRAQHVKITNLTLLITTVPDNKTSHPKDQGVNKKQKYSLGPWSHIIALITSHIIALITLRIRVIALLALIHSHIIALINSHILALLALIALITLITSNIVTLITSHITNLIELIASHKIVLITCHKLALTSLITKIMRLPARCTNNKLNQPCVTDGQRPKLSLITLITKVPNSHPNAPNDQGIQL
jgi:hypothetical protein